MSYKIYTAEFDDVLTSRVLLEEKPELGEAKRREWFVTRATADAVRDEIVVPDVPPTNSVTFLVDMSGSMRGEAAYKVLQAITEAGDALETAGHDFEVFGHTTVSWKGGKVRDKWIEDGRPQQPGRLNALRIISLHEKGQSWAESRDTLIACLQDGMFKENIDGEVLRWAANRRSGRIVMVGDGAPIDDSTLSTNPEDYLRRDLDNTLQAMADAGREVVHVAVSHHQLSEVESQELTQKLAHEIVSSAYDSRSIANALVFAALSDEAPLAVPGRTGVRIVASEPQEGMEP